VFSRKGKLDLIIKHTITLKEALLGFTAAIQHMDGSSITLSREAVTQNGSSHFSV
jgi:DnaJ-class molecular chaperone